MFPALLAAALLAAADPPIELVRQAVADTAVAQLEKIDPGWNPDQRDCAGFVRFVFRRAFSTLGAQRDAPWRDAQGRKVAFADAQTLVAHSFAPLGRGDAARAELRTGDLLAFRQAHGGDGEEVWHLMLVVRPTAQAAPFVIYHPGEKGAALRSGSLEDLLRSAPSEWRPSADNPSFLGFYRFKEWAS